jgi:hypothetical protein
VEKTGFEARVRALLATRPDQALKLQMAPHPMPEGMNVFSSLFRDPQFGFYVFVYFQQP